MRVHTCCPEFQCVQCGEEFYEHSVIKRHLTGKHGLSPTEVSANFLRLERKPKGVNLWWNVCVRLKSLYIKPWQCDFLSLIIKFLHLNIIIQSCCLCCCCCCRRHFGLEWHSLLFRNNRKLIWVFSVVYLAVEYWILSYERFFTC